LQLARAHGFLLGDPNLSFRFDLQPSLPAPPQTLDVRGGLVHLPLLGNALSQNTPAPVSPVPILYLRCIGVPLCEDEDKKTCR